MALAACNLPSAFAFHNRVAAPYSFQQNGTFGCVQSCLSQYANKGALGHSSTAIHFVCKAHKSSTRVAQRSVRVIPQSCLALSSKAASEKKQLAKEVPRKQSVLQSSFLCKQSSSYVALSSSVLVSHAAWAIFGLYPASDSTLSHQTTRKCRTPVILAGRGPARGTAWTFIGIFTGVFVAALLALTSFVIVPSGSVGVRTTFSQVERQVLQPGVYFINPLVSSIQNFTTKTQLIVADESDVPTKEGLVVELDVSILHSLEPAKAADLYVTVGPDYVNKIILPELHSAVANITSEYSARALYTDARAQLTRELTSYLQHKLSHKGIVIEDVLLRAIKLPEQLTNAIQDKLRTEQEAQRMEFVLLKEQQEAERKMIEAKGIATFQKIVSQGISPQLLQWKGIEATQELAKSQNSKIVLIGNAANGLPIILGGADNKKR